MASFYGPEGAHSEVFRMLMLLSSIISAIFSIFNIALIHQMKLKNGHIMLILAMAYSQLIYDVSFYPGVVAIKQEWIVVLANVLQLVGGIAVSIYSNVMATVVLLVIARKKSFDIMSHFHEYNWACVICITIENLMYLLAVGDPQKYGTLSDIALSYVYYYLRLLSIFYNFVATGVAYYYVRKLLSHLTAVREGQRSLSTASSSAKKLTIQEEAICTLATRMQYYPLVQAISRSGCAWYEFQYGWDFDPDTVTPLRFVAQCYLAFITPAASIGYFVLFLMMQPLAYKTFCGWFRCDFRPLDKKNEDDKSSCVSTIPVSSVGGISMHDLPPVDNPLRRDDMEDDRVRQTVVEEDVEEDVRDSMMRPSQWGAAVDANPRLSYNIDRYTQYQLNIKEISDEELFEIIDTHID